MQCMVINPFNYQHFNLAEFSLEVGSEQIPLPKLKCNMDNDSSDILRPLFSVLLANHSLFSNEELGINPSNYRKCFFSLGFEPNATWSKL